MATKHMRAASPMLRAAEHVRESGKVQRAALATQPSLSGDMFARKAAQQGLSFSDFCAMVRAREPAVTVSANSTASFKRRSTLSS